MNRILTVVSLAVTLFAFPSAAAATTTVIPANLGVDWFSAPPIVDTRPGGSVSLLAGPATPPLGVGSVHMGTTGPSAKAQFFTSRYVGTPLASLSAISYAAYRDAASTNPAVQTISLNIQIDKNGGTLDPGDFATLVFEPIYNPTQGPIVPGAWQTWDAYAGGSAIWWSTRVIPGVPSAFSSFVPLGTIIGANPSATILGLGFNIGSGWTGVFSGAADALSIGGDTFDFEPDSDGDGVADAVDHCPSSVLGGNVDVNGAAPGTTSIPNVTNFDGNGCSVQDLVNACAATPRNHGEYVNCISALAQRLRAAGLITGRQQGEMVSSAARSTIGK